MNTRVWSHGPILLPLCVTHSTATLLFGAACSSATPPMAMPPPWGPSSVSLTPFFQNQEAGLPQSSSPGLVLRLGVVIHQGLHTLLSHVGQHRECGLHNEVNETCSAEGDTMTMS